MPSTIHSPRAHVSESPPHCINVRETLACMPIHAPPRPSPRSRLQLCCPRRPRPPPEPRAALGPCAWRAIPPHWSTRSRSHSLRTAPVRCTGVNTTVNTVVQRLLCAEYGVWMKTGYDHCIDASRWSRTLSTNDATCCFHPSASKHLGESPMSCSNVRRACFMVSVLHPAPTSRVSASGSTRAQHGVEVETDGGRRVLLALFVRLEEGSTGLHCVTQPPCITPRPGRRVSTPAGPPQFKHERRLTTCRVLERYATRCGSRGSLRVSIRSSSVPCVRSAAAIVTRSWKLCFQLGEVGRSSQRGPPPEVLGTPPVMVV